MFQKYLYHYLIHPTGIIMYCTEMSLLFHGWFMTYKVVHITKKGLDLLAKEDFHSNKVYLYNQRLLYQPFLLRVKVPEINNNEKEPTPFSRFYSQCISLKSERLDKLFGVEPVN